MIWVFDKQNFIQNILLAQDVFLTHKSVHLVLLLHTKNEKLLNFQLWISESPDSYKPELAQLLYPVFTHLYLELVCAGHKLAAAKFIKKHQSTFLSNFEFATFIRQLGNVTSPEDITRDEVVKIFMVMIELNCTFYLILQVPSTSLLIKFCAYSVLPSVE